MPSSMKELHDLKVDACAASQHTMREAQSGVGCCACCCWCTVLTCAVQCYIHIVSKLRLLLIPDSDAAMQVHVPVQVTLIMLCSLFPTVDLIASARCLNGQAAAGVGPEGSLPRPQREGLHKDAEAAAY